MSCLCLLLVIAHKYICFESLFFGYYINQFSSGKYGSLNCETCIYFEILIHRISVCEMANNQLDKLPNKSEAISISRNEVSSGKATSQNRSLVLVWPVKKREGVAREMDFLHSCTNSGKRAVDRRVIKRLRTQLVNFSSPLASRFSESRATRQFCPLTIRDFSQASFVGQNVVISLTRQCRKNYISVFQ